MSLGDIETGSDAAGVASRLSDVLHLPVKIGTREIGLTVSVGIALFPQDGADAKTHDAFRGWEGSFERTLRMLADARDIGLPVQINTSISP